MVGRLRTRSAQVCLLVAVAVSIATAQRSKFDPAGSQPAKQHDSIVDFTLKQINPGDKDYGECITEARRMALDESIKSGLYWSNLVALSLFALSLLTLAYQVREQARRERIVAGILCQYHNSWVRARSVASDLAAKYNALVASANAAAESQLRQAMPEAVTSASGAVRPPSNGGSNAPIVASRAAETTVTKPFTASRLTAPNATPVQAVDLISSNNALQHQLELARQREQNLRQQLNSSEQKLEEEKRKNRTLRGG